jgi:hypothetical protein
MAEFAPIHLQPSDVGRYVNQITERPVVDRRGFPAQLGVSIKPAGLSATASAPRCKSPVCPIQLA